MAARIKTLALEAEADRCLVIVPRVTARTGEFLERNGIDYIDLRGNIQITVVDSTSLHKAERRIGVTGDTSRSRLAPGTGFRSFHRKKGGRHQCNPRGSPGS